eukprot:g2517.t1
MLRKWLGKRSPNKAPRQKKPDDDRSESEGTSSSPAKQVPRLRSPLTELQPRLNNPIPVLFHSTDPFLWDPDVVELQDFRTTASSTASATASGTASATASGTGSATASSAASATASSTSSTTAHDEWDGRSLDAEMALLCYRRSPEDIQDEIDVANRVTGGETAVDPHGQVWRVISRLRSDEPAPADEEWADEYQQQCGKVLSDDKRVLLSQQDGASGLRGRSLLPVTMFTTWALSSDKNMTSDAADMVVPTSSEDTYYQAYQLRSGRLCLTCTLSISFMHMLRCDASTLEAQPSAREGLEAQLADLEWKLCQLGMAACDAAASESLDHDLGPALDYRIAALGDEAEDLQSRILEIEAKLAALPNVEQEQGGFHMMDLVGVTDRDTDAVDARTGFYKPPAALHDFASTLGAASFGWALGQGDDRPILIVQGELGYRVAVEQCRVKSMSLAPWTDEMYAALGIEPDLIQYMQGTETRWGIHSIDGGRQLLVVIPSLGATFAGPGGGARTKASAAASSAGGEGEAVRRARLAMATSSHAIVAVHYTVNVLRALGGRQSIAFCDSLLWHGVAGVKGSTVEAMRRVEAIIAYRLSEEEWEHPSQRGGKIGGKIGGAAISYEKLAAAEAAGDKVAEQKQMKGLFGNGRDKPGRVGGGKTGGKIGGAAISYKKLAAAKAAGDKVAEQKQMEGLFGNGQDKPGRVGIKPGKWEEFKDGRITITVEGKKGNDDVAFAAAGTQAAATLGAKL